MAKRKWSFGHGEGAGTWRKEQAFFDLLEMCLTMTKARSMIDRPYWHFDLNAGCGVNKKAGCDGSPLVFLSAVARTQRPGVRAYFCDNDPAAASALKGRLVAVPSEVRSEVVCCDNGEFLKRAAGTILAEDDCEAVGTCLCDPNGIKEYSLPVSALAEFFSRFRRIDFILNVNISVMNRVRGAIAAGFKGFDWFIPLREMMSRFHKYFWWVRNIPPNGGDKFTVLFGTNHRLQNPKRFGQFHPSDSPTGRRILEGGKRVEDSQSLLWRDL